MFLYAVMLFHVLLCFVILQNIFVMLYRDFVCYNIVLCLIILFCNDATWFYRLQYCIVSYYVIL